MITSLRVDNFKRIRTVQINPDGSEVVVSGNNGQGKSSILDAIQVALCGKVAMPERPVRDGAASASVVVDVDGYRVARTITPDGGGKLTITTGEGHLVSQPQTWLDAKIGRLAFDPSTFLRQKPVEQADTLRKITGVDVADLDARKASVFAERTQIGRDRDAAKGAADALPRHNGVGTEEQSIAVVMQAQTEATAKAAARADAVRLADEHRRAAAEKRARVDQLRATIAEATAAHVRTVAEVDAWESTEIARIRDAATGRRAAASATRDTTITDAGTRIANNEAAIPKHDADADAADALAASIVVPDVTDAAGKIAEIETHNRKVRENARHAEAAARAAGLAEKYAAHTATLEQIAAERAARIAAAKMPIEGLSFDDAGALTFGGVPLSQASQAEQIRVSMAIGIALSPGMKIVLIRDGSLLDPNSRALVHQIAEEAGAQTWIEVVGRESGAVEIVDGAQV